MQLDTKTFQLPAVCHRDRLHLTKWRPRLTYEVYEDEDHCSLQERHAVRLETVDPHGKRGEYFHKSMV